MSKGRIYIEFNCFLVHRKLITILLEIIRTTDAISFHCFFVRKENSHFVRRNSLPYFPCVVGFLFFFLNQGTKHLCETYVLRNTGGVRHDNGRKEANSHMNPFYQNGTRSHALKHKKDKEVLCRFFFMTHA